MQCADINYQSYIVGACSVDSIEIFRSHAYKSCSESLYASNVLVNHMLKLEWDKEVVAFINLVSSTRDHRGLGSVPYIARASRDQGLLFRLGSL